MTNKEVIVTLQDCRNSGVFCVDGGKAFFEKHQLNWKDFLKNGIRSDILESFNDGMVNKIVETARGRQ